MDSSMPLFLVAVPQMGDPNFARTVTLLLNHKKDTGAMGLVINQPSDLTLGTFARSQGLECHHNLENIPVFKGGPVDTQRGWILHTDSEVTERQEIMPGLFLSGTIATLSHLLEKGSLPLRLILGYAGWSPEQLEWELSQGSWITTKPKLTHLFETEPAQVWNAVHKDMGIDPFQVVSCSGVH